MHKRLFFLFILLFNFGWTQAPDYVSQDGLVGWWPFNANTNDESGNGNDGTNNDATLTTDRFGEPNSAYYFDDNNNQFIEIGESNSINNCTNMSISFWFNISANNSYSHFINKTAIPAGGIPEDKQFIVSLNSTGLYFYFDATNYFQSNITPEFNQWNHLVISYDYGTFNNPDHCHFYLNGELIASFSTTAGLAQTNYNMRFGSYADLTTNTVAGKIDDIGIWNRTLTECQIQDLFNSELNFPTVDLGPDQTLCQGDSVLLDAGPDQASYKWNTGATTQTIYATTSGNYAAEVGSNPAVENEYSMSFDGVDNFISIGDNLGFEYTDPFTIEAWVRTSQATDIKQIISKLNENFVGWGMQLDNGRLSAYVSSNWLTNYSLIGGTTIISDGNWHHTAMTYDGATNITLYVDGVMETTSYQVNNLSQSIINAVPTEIGCYNGNDNRDEFWDGLIENIAIYNTQKSMLGIRESMKCPPNGSEVELIGYWNFEEGSGNNALDLSPSGNNGNINGSSYSD